MSGYDDDTLALLKLVLCQGVGGVGVYRLVQEFGSPSAAAASSGERLRSVKGITADAAQALARGPDDAAVQSELELIEKAHVRLVSFFSDEYPQALKYLESDAPPLLWIKGEYKPSDHLAIGIVGSRRCTHYGRSQARRFAMSLSGMGFTIVSGMARGVDSEAHRATIQAKGRSIAVLGCGLGAVSSTDDMELGSEIAAHGALISELPMMSPPRPGNFPPRNRLISGLSLGVLVVEAGSRSGSLITARWAGQQGRGVFAIPGNVDSPASRGCHELIRDGAILVQDPQDVVEALGPLSEPIKMPSADGESEAVTTVDDARAMLLNEREKEMLNLLSRSPLQIDQIVAETGLAVSIVSSTLLTLEIRGMVKQLSGQRYVRR